MKALAKSTNGGSPRGGGGGQAAGSGGRGNAFAQDRLDRKAKEALSPAQEAGKAKFREETGRVRGEFRGWRDALLAETGTIVGTEVFRTKSAAAWGHFDDDAHAMWASKRARIADVELDEDEAQTEVKGSVGALENVLEAREAELGKDLRTTWGCRGAKVHWQELRRSARETVDQWESDALAEMQDAERKKALSAEIDAARDTYETSAKAARVTVQQWIEAAETFTEQDAVGQVRAEMGPLWSVLEREVKAAIEEARTISIDVPFYSQLIGGPDFAQCHSD